MKTRASIKKRTADCKLVRRKGKLYIINKKNPKIHYVIGTRFQKFSIILKRLLPDLWFEKILIKYNKL